MSGKTLAEKTKMLTQHQHILHRPEMYIGPMSIALRDFNILSNGKIRSENVEYVPAILKLIDEVISNSVDEFRRCQNGSSKSGVTKISVDIQKNGLVTVTDNGGISGELHPEYQLAYPEIFFGHLMAGTNYDDTESRDVTGTNGIGATLANVFSTEFSVKTSTSISDSVYYKHWSNNMYVTEPAEYLKSDFKGTEIKFKLDLSRFDQNGSLELSEDFIKIILSRCINAAGPNIGLEINFSCIDYQISQTFRFNSFKEYVLLYQGITEETLIGEKTDQWEYYIFPNESPNNNMEVGFVNGSPCHLGRHFAMAIWNTQELINPYLKKAKIPLADFKMLRTKASFFVNISVSNPKYKDQTKEVLETKDVELTKTGLPVFSKKIQKQIIESDLIQLIKDWYIISQAAAENKKIRDTNKALKQIKRIDKLMEANEKHNRKACQLWLFEGQSASSGFEVGRNPEFQAKYDLRGKVMSALASQSQIMSNQEYCDVLAAFGLRFGEKPNLEKLRYGMLIICTDMDVDGSSIAGMLMAFFVMHFPDLVEAGMIYRALSPIIIANKGDDTKLFYRMEDYKLVENKLKGYNIRYIKGTGGLTDDEYGMMVQQPFLQKINTDEYSIEKIHDWFGDDSSRRKKYFEESNAA